MLGRHRYQSRSHAQAASEIGRRPPIGRWVSPGWCIVSCTPAMASGSRHTIAGRRMLPRRLCCYMGCACRANHGAPLPICCLRCSAIACTRETSKYPPIRSQHEPPPQMNISQDPRTHLGRGAATTPRRRHKRRSWPVQDMRQRRRRRRLRRRLGTDPTSVIGSPSVALDIAETLLASIPGQDISDKLWASVAVTPLAALLFAASIQDETSGIEWVRRAISNVDADASLPGWRQAAEICRRPTRQSAQSLGETLLRIATFDPRQRSSIVYIMNAALALWAADDVKGTRAALCRVLTLRRKSAKSGAGHEVQW